MRIQKYQSQSYSRRKFHCYRFSFRDQRLRLILMEFCEDINRNYDYRKMDDYNIIKEIYCENKEAIAEYLESDPAEVEKLGKHLVENGKSAKQDYFKFKRIERKSKKYNKEDQDKLEKAEKLEDSIKEWEKGVEKSFKQILDYLGFISTEEFSSSGSKTDAIGEATSGKQITSDYVKDRVQSLEEKIYEPEPSEAGQ